MRMLLGLLASLRGRIDPARWWLGFVIIAAANVLGGLVLDPDFFFSDVPAASWPDTLWQLALIYPGTAITVKRFNDTNRPAWLGYLFAPVSALLVLRPHFAAQLAAIDPWVKLTIVLPMFAYSLFAFIDNGFVRGTEGPNRYGADPLARG